MYKRQDLGVRIPVVLDDMGKSMVLRKVAGLKRGKLSLYSGHLEQTGFIGQLKSQISELYQYGITPDMLRDCLLYTSQERARFRWSWPS